MSTVIRVEHLSKQYRLGMIGGATLREDLSRWWALKRGKDDPLATVGTGAGQPARIGERFWALKDVSFEVKQGEILGIIGRNGAGKSTLLKILSRITAPTEGVVKVKGRIGSLLEVGTGFHPELTGRENIYLNGAILGMSRREVDRKLDEIIGFSEVEQFIDTPVKRYSSGMYVRLAFAVAAHLDPEILIVDEVLAVGDAAFQKKCLGKMGDVAGEGRTVLFVSHNMGSIAGLCPRTALMDHGRMVQIQGTDAVLRLYLGQSSAALEDSRFAPPENARVGFTRVWITNSNGYITANIDVRESLHINFEFVVRVPVANVDLGVWVESHQGTPICSTNLSDSTDGHIRPLEPGIYVCSLDVPSHFFAPNTYRVKVMAHVPGVRAEDFRRDAVTFVVVETGSKWRRYSQPWRHGCVLTTFPATLTRRGDLVGYDDIGHKSSCHE